MNDFDIKLALKDILKTINEDAYPADKYYQIKEILLYYNLLGEQND